MKNKTRNNKRKPLLVVALVLMVALVLGMGAMTYSRYISTAEMDDGKTTATVAKWGYVVTINADNADVFLAVRNAHPPDNIHTVFVEDAV